jgi:hypothetical protein
MTAPTELLRSKSTHRLPVELASTAAEIRASEELGCRLFAGELGARRVGACRGMDADRHDPQRGHLPLLGAARSDRHYARHFLRPAEKVAPR